MSIAVPLVRTSERTQFKRCRWAWDRAFNDRIKPKHAAPPLRFGSLVHKSLEKFYRPGLKRGPRPATTFQKLYAAELKEQTAIGFRDEDGTWHNAAELGVGMLEHYYETYGKDDLYEIVATEQAFEVPVLNPRSGRVMFHYVGILDGIWRNRSSRKLGIADHKTAKAISTAHLALDEQAGSYWTWGVDWLYEKGILKPNQRLEGIIFNFLRKALKDDRPQNDEGLYLNQPTKAELKEFGDNYPGSVSKNQPPVYFHRENTYRTEPEREKKRRDVLNEVREMGMVRDGKLAIYKNPGQMNCGGCGFKDICELEEAGADWEALRDATMAPWDPYAEHELYDRN